MGVLLKQDDKRSDLQKRLAQELENRNWDRDRKPADEPDGVEDSRYIEGTKKTTSLAWVWVLVLIAFVALLIWLTVTGA